MTTVAALEGLLPPEAVAEPAGSWAERVPGLIGIVSPSGAEEAARVLDWASGRGVAVVPAASGRRLGAVRAHGPAIVLGSSRLTGLEIYEPADVTFTAGAGTSLREIDETLRENRQWLPFDPPDVFDRTLGGLVATAASGPLWMGYGAIRNHVLGMTVATGDGRVLRLGGRVVKNVAGFDLLKPMVGSRGRLAFITSVCMRAFPVPAEERILVARADRLSDLVDAGHLVGTARVMPVSSVLEGRSDGGATLTVRLHGAGSTVDADRATLERHLGRSLERLDEAPQATDGGGPLALVVTVLPSRLATVIDALDGLGAWSVRVDTYAGRVRVEAAEASRDAVLVLRAVAEGVGGALRVTRAPATVDTAGLSTEGSDAERSLVRSVARAFDPEGVLWRS